MKGYFYKNYFLSNLYLNFHKVDEDLYRSAQPTKKQLEKLIDKYGIKTIINLRGKEHINDLKYEEEVTKEKDVNLINIKLNSRGFPKKEDFLNLYNIFKNIEYPALIHCKSGSDRTGLVAVLYLYLIKNVPLKKALKQLSFFPYGHIKYSQAGKLDFIFEKYIEFNKKTPISFLEWIKHHYDRDALSMEFKKKSHFLDFLNDKILKRE